jgi:hypothetical protein
MWMVIARQPSPDAAYWPGRRTLSLLDAIVWPAVWVGAVSSMSMNAGLIGTGIVLLAIFAALARSRRALSDNARYRFTTYRWGIFLAALCALGAVLKATL